MYVVYFYSDITLSKGHHGSRGASKNKLKDTSFIFSMTNVITLSIFRTHAHDEFLKVLEMKSTSILFLLFENEQCIYPKSGLNGTQYIDVK